MVYILKIGAKIIKMPLCFKHTGSTDRTCIILHWVIWGFQSDWHATSTWRALTGLWLVPGEVKEEGLMLSKDVWRGGGEKKVRQINNGILSRLCSLSLLFSVPLSLLLILFRAPISFTSWVHSRTLKSIQNCQTLWQDLPVHMFVLS